VELEEYDRLHALELEHWRFRALRRVIASALRRHPPRGAGGAARVLDAGCGTGGTTLALGQIGAAVGVDLHPRALTLAARRGLSRLVRARVDALPFAAGVFDAVVSVDVLYHRAVPDDAAALRELARVCRPGGVIVLWLPAHESLRSSHDVQVHGARRYDRRRARALVAAAGLEIERLTGVGALLAPLALARARLEGDSPPAQSAVARTPRPLNALLAGLLALEGELGLRAPLPFGISLLAVLRVPEARHPPGAR
jgi:SAM-dependent methyltransferase